MGRAGIYEKNYVLCDKYLVKYFLDEMKIQDTYHNTVEIQDENFKAGMSISPSTER
jgi:hypothetical protein